MGIMINAEKVNNIIEEICNDLLNGKIINELTIEAIILTGSFVYGQVHEYSDIDIFVVVLEKLNYIRHISFYKQQKLIQLRICSYEKFVTDCMIHERKRPAAFSCKVLYDKNGRCTESITSSKQFLDLGPAKMNLQQKERLKNTIKNEMNTLMGLISSEKYISAVLLVNELLGMNIDYYNNENGHWMSNNNYLYDELQKHNEEIYIIVENIILENDLQEKVKNLLKLCNLVIEDYEILRGEYIYDEVIS